MINESLNHVTIIPDYWKILTLISVPMIQGVSNEKKYIYISYFFFACHYVLDNNIGHLTLERFGDNLD